MQTPKILYFTQLAFSDVSMARIKKIGELVEISSLDEVSNSDLETINIAFAPLSFRFGSHFFDRAPNLRVIASNTTGVPHIDLVAAATRNISVCALHNQQDFLEQITPTAEHTIGLMLAVSRKIPSAFQEVKNGIWNRWNWGASRMLSRCSIGIVGFGRLGRKVAAITSAMGMKVYWYDPNVSGGEPSLEVLATKSDILSIHAVSHPSTYRLVSRNILKALPQGSIVLNTARGEILDLNALLDLMEDGHIAAAGLDTLEGEYSPEFERTFARSRVLQYCNENDNLILTPHIGGSTLDAWEETQLRVISLIEAELPFE